MQDVSCCTLMIYSILANTMKWMHHDQLISIKTFLIFAVFVLSHGCCHLTEFSCIFSLKQEQKSLELLMKRWGKTLKSMLMAFWQYIANATFSRIKPTTNIFHQICNNGCLLQLITIFLLLSLPVISDFLCKINEQLCSKFESK